jgi:hypothetical protein
MSKTKIMGVVLAAVSSRLEGFQKYTPNLPDPSLIRGRDFALVRLSENFCHFVVLVKHKSEESITLEAGWSNQNRFPRVSPRPCSADPDPEMYYPEYVFRPRRSVHGREFWWRLPVETCEGTVVDELADSISQVINAQVEPVLLRRF